MRTWAGRFSRWEFDSLLLMVGFSQNQAFPLPPPAVCSIHFCPRLQPCLGRGRWTTLLWWGSEQGGQEGAHHQRRAWWAAWVNARAVTGSIAQRMSKREGQFPLLAQRQVREISSRNQDLPSLAPSSLPSHEDSKAREGSVIAHQKTQTWWALETLILQGGGRKAISPKFKCSSSMH
jgi:hypothetical protein